MKTDCQKFVVSLSAIALNSSIRLSDARDFKGDEFRNPNDFDDCAEAGKLVVQIANWGRFEGKPSDILSALKKKAEARALIA